MELHRNPSQMDSDRWQGDSCFKAMKKSTNCYYSSHYEDESFERKSVQSSASSALSINFS